MWLLIFDVIKNLLRYVFVSALRIIIDAYYMPQYSTPPIYYITR